MDIESDEEEAVYILQPNETIGHYMSWDKSSLRLIHKTIPQW
jgi:hypothetical protein